MIAIGVDVGGTFTDLVFCDLSTERLAIHKVATTPGNPSRGVMTGIGELCKEVGIEPSQIDYLFHGTTIATNAVLEHKGARAGMITNDGFRDIVHVARHQRVEHYSIMQELPWQSRPLIKRRDRKVVGGRLIPPRGDELVALDEDAVRRVAGELRDAGVDAIAVCFLFSYLNASHEERAKQIVREVHPDAFVTTSSFIAPQFREFERFTTASLAAFVGPKVRSYIDDLAAALRDAGVRGELRIMASNGGVATAAMVADKPTLTLLSGLAAGVLGGAWIGALAGRKHLITFDIGGTSADIGIVNNGAFVETDARSTSIAGFPLLTPMIDIHTIGAGGGSIAHVDRGGAFRVGPQSAGASPGPAAYGRGGDQPTVTDAHVFLGRLDPDDFLGGSVKLDVKASRRVIETLAAQLKIPPQEAAAGVLTIINSNMANAIRSRTVQKGIDPRNFALVAFGGAGPLHGVEVAEMLGIPEVIIPRYPGITSAMGLLTTDLKYDLARTQFQTSNAIDLVRLNSDLKQMEASLVAQFAADKIDVRDVSFERTADLRYVGQGYELKIALPAGDISPTLLEQVWVAFHAAHAVDYGHAFEQNLIEIVNVRVIGRGALPKLNRLKPPRSGELEDAYVKTVDCIFRVDQRLTEVKTPVYRRDLLPAHSLVQGAAILLQKDSTTVVPPGWSAMVDDSDNIIIKRGDVS